jgi:hypothetical protein
MVMDGKLSVWINRRRAVLITSNDLEYGREFMGEEGGNDIVELCNVSFT